MARAFEAVDRDRVGAHALGRERMAHGGTLVDHFHAMGLEGGDVFVGPIAGGFDGGDPASMIACRYSA
jgi:hypothetical protein